MTNYDLYISRIFHSVFGHRHLKPGNRNGYIHVTREQKFTGVMDLIWFVFYSTTAILSRVKVET